MARWTGLFPFLFFMSVSFSAEPPADSTQVPVVVDQIVAVVNDQVIFLSDLHRDELFFEEGVPGSVRERIEKRVDHQLLLEEAKRFVLKPPSEEEVNDALKKVGQRFKTEGRLQIQLREAGMSLQELREEVLGRVWIKTLLRDRIGFFIFVTEEEKEQYDQQHQDDFKEKSPEARSEQIRAILESEKEKIKTQEYIAQLRSRAKVRVNIR